MATAEMTIQKKENKGRSGISLLEMLISLGIFAVIVLPLVSMPIKAKEQNNTTLNTDKLSASITEALNKTLSNDVNNAISFLPFNNLGAGVKYGETNYQLPADNAHMLFMAYPNSSGPGDTYVAYRVFKKKAITDFGDVTGGGGTATAQTLTAPPSETVYQIQRYESKSPFALSSDIVQSTGWKWNTLGGNNTAKAMNFSPIKFMYFQYGYCTDSPKKADAVLLVADETSCVNGEITNNSAFNITVGNTTITQDPVYYKLGSQQASLDTASKIYPATVILKNYGDMNTIYTGTTEYPLTTDIAYDYLNNEILIASNNTSRSEFYINKCKPESGCTGAPSTSIDKYFPIKLVSSSIGYPGSTYDFESTTEDNDGNIYVLAKDTTTPAAKILKFTAKGIFDSSFFVDPNSIAITFDPSTPDELLIVNQTGTTPKTTIISSYLTNPISIGTSVVKPTASSANLNTIVGNNTIVAFDIDPYSNRLILMNSAGAVYVIPHSIDKDLTTGAKRYFVLNRPVNPGIYAEDPIAAYYGIAFDPINNKFYATLGSSATLASIGNSLRFNRTYQ